MSFTVPDSYRAQLSGGELAERADWLAGVPGLARRYARAWSLTRDGEPLHGYVAIVWPMRTAAGVPVMLKLSWPDDETQDEGLALVTWAGRGSVALLAQEGNALLLERLDPHRCLDDEPIDLAVTTAATLLRRLSVPAPPGMHRSTADVAAKWAALLPGRAAGTPIPRRIVDRAVGYCRDLARDAPAPLLVDEDLHYFNVLRGQREPWLVIDPKAIAGEPEYGVVPMLWNRYAETGGAQGIRARFDRIVAVAELDADRARGWTLIRAVMNWLWTLGDAGSHDARVAAEIAAVIAR